LIMDTVIVSGKNAQLLRLLLQVFCSE